MRLQVYDFKVQSANIKGQRSPAILQFQVPPDVPLLRVANNNKAFICLPFRQDFTVQNSGGSAATPTITLDYPIASQPAEDAIGENVWVYYSSDGTNFNPGAKVTSAPSADGQFQVTSESGGTIRVYVPASATRYFRVYFRSGAGRLLVTRQPPTESADQRLISVFEKDLKTLHEMNQIKASSNLVLGGDAVFPAKSYIRLEVVMPDVTATQSSESNITKTVTRAALFIPYTIDPTPWIGEKTIGVIDLPVRY